MQRIGVQAKSRPVDGQVELTIGGQRRDQAIQRLHVGTTQFLRSEELPVVKIDAVAQRESG